MSEKTLKFNNIILNEKEFHKSKKPIDLLSINLDQIVVPDKFKHMKEGEIVKPLWIILHQISGYTKIF